MPPVFIWEHLGVHSEVFGQLSYKMTSKRFYYTILEILPSHSSTHENRGQLRPLLVSVSGQTPMGAFAQCFPHQLYVCKSPVLD